MSEQDDEDAAIAAYNKRMEEKASKVAASKAASLKQLAEAAERARHDVAKTKWSEEQLRDVSNITGAADIASAELAAAERLKKESKKPRRGTIRSLSRKEYNEYKRKMRHERKIQMPFTDAIRHLKKLEEKDKREAIRKEIKEEAEYQRQENRKSRAQKAREKRLLARLEQLRRIPKNQLCQHCGEHKPHNSQWIITKSWVGCVACSMKIPKEERS